MGSLFVIVFSSVPSFVGNINASSTVFTLLLINKLEIVLIKSLKRLPYNLIPFVLSMFTLINALDSFDFFKNIIYFTSITCNNNISIRMIHLSFIIGDAIPCTVSRNTENLFTAVLFYNSKGGF